MEYQVGAIDELAKRLEVASVIVLLEPLRLSDPFIDIIKMLIVHISIFLMNIFLDLARTFQSHSRDQVDTSLTGIQVKPVGNHPTIASSKNTPLKTSVTKGAQGSLSSPNQLSEQSSSSGIQLQLSSSITPSTSTTTSSPVITDYILLCINDSKFLIT